LFGCALLWSRGVCAEPSVRWEGPSGCPTAEQGRAEIARLLGRPLANVAVELSAAVHIRRRGQTGFESTIEVTQAGVVRKRVMRDGDCTVLGRAAAVVVALAIDPATEVVAPATGDEVTTPGDDSSSTGTGRVTEGGKPTTGGPSGDQAGATASPAPAPSGVGGSGARATSSTESTQAEDARPEPSPAAEARQPAPANATRSPADLHAFVGAAAALGTGILPDLAPGGTLSAGVSMRVSRAAVRLSYATPEHAVLADPAGVGGRIGLMAVAVEAGLHPRVSRIELPLVAGFEAGAFVATGERLSDGQTRHPLWLAGYLGGGAMLLLGPMFAVGLRLEATVPLRRPRFAILDDVGVVHSIHRPATLAGRGSVELELHFR
jgi:hypothetical protein